MYYKQVYRIDTPWSVTLGKTLSWQMERRRCCYSWAGRSNHHVGKGLWERGLPWPRRSWDQPSADVIKWKPQPTILRNWILATIAWSWKSTSTFGGEYSLAKTLFAEPCKALSRGPRLLTRIPYPQKGWDNVCVFCLSTELEITCYTAQETNSRCKLHFISD